MGIRRTNRDSVGRSQGRLRAFRHGVPEGVSQVLRVVGVSGSREGFRLSCAYQGGPGGPFGPDGPTSGLTLYAGSPAVLPIIPSQASNRVTVSEPQKAERP